MCTSRRAAGVPCGGLEPAAAEPGLHASISCCIRNDTARPSGAGTGRRERRGRGAEPAGQARKGGGGTRRQVRPAWVGTALAASRRTQAVPAPGPPPAPDPHPGRGTGGRASMHGTLPTGTRPGRLIVPALATAIPDRPSGFPCWLLQGNRPERRGNAGLSERAGSCGQAETEAIPCIFPPIRESIHAGGETGSPRTASTTSRNPLFQLAFYPHDTCPETPGNPGLCRRCQNMRAVGDAARPKAAAEWWRASHLTLSAVRVFQARTGARRARVECGPRRNRASRASFAAGRPKGRMAKRASAL
jgi:hypothetical protein